MAGRMTWAWMSTVVVVMCMLSALFLSAETSPQTSTASTPAGPKATAPVREDFHEDWNSITLAGSNLKPQPPVLGQKDNSPEARYTKELYQLQWRPYDPLDLYVIKPKGVAKPPVILYLYSYPQDTERFKDDLWCTTVTSDGYAAVGFVSALTGHRVAGNRPIKEWFVSELQETLATSTHDVQMILNYLAGRGDLDTDHVGMFGQGSGGAIAILASAADPRIKAVDVLTPWGDWPNWLAKSSVIQESERARYVTPEFLSRVAPLDPVSWISKTKAQYLRIQDVRQSPEMPDASQEKIEASAPEFATINQFGDTAALYPKVAGGGGLLGWIKAQLKPDAASATMTDKSERVHFYQAQGKAKGAPK